MHHSGYYLVSLIFGTTIPTSFNILVKCFFYTCFTSFSCSVHFCFFVEYFTIPIKLFVYARAPPPSNHANPRAWAPPFFETWNARAHAEICFQQIRKIFDFTALSKVSKILLVKDHARNRKEPFCVKTIKSTCATLVVARPVQLKKMMNKSVVWPISISQCSCVL